MVRQRIIEEASELFASAGLKNTTMDDLARQMGISKRTIYENFKDKEELLVACIDWFHEQNKAFSRLVFERADNVVDAVLALLKKGAKHAKTQRFDMMGDIRKYYPQVFKEHLTCQHEDMNQKMSEMLQRGIDEGVFRSDLNPEIIAHVFSKQAEGMWQTDRELDRFAFSELFENMVLTFLRGICTLKGVEIIDKFKHHENKFYSSNQ